MRILYLSADRGIPIRGHKGAAVHVRAMTAAFARAGHRVTIASPNPGPANGPDLAWALLHIPLPRYHGPAVSPEEIRDRRSQEYSDTLVAALEPLLRAGHFDLIYERYSLWSDAGARLAQAANRPLVLEVNAPLLDEAARYRSLTNRDLAIQIEAVQFKAASLITVVSDNLRDYVLARGGRPDRVLVLPNGVDPHHFHPAVRGGSVHRRYQLHGKIVVGFVGRARPWHDLPTLFQAVAQLRQEDERYHLLLVGQMPDDIADQLASHGLSQAATVTGPVAHDEIPSYIAACDVAVSSHGEAENFYFSPLKLFEYLACGVPTVAANLGQPAAIIEHGKTGYLYRPGDPASLAGRIRDYGADPALARLIAWQGAVMALEKYTWQGNAAAVLAAVGGPATAAAHTGSNGHRPLNGPVAVEVRPAAVPGPAAPELPILDRKLRQRLYRATRPDLAGPLLARHLRRKLGRGITVCDIEILKYKPGRRCVLRYHFSGTGGSAEEPAAGVIGKVFRDERGRRLHRLHKLLRQAGFGPGHGGEIMVPDSLAYVPEMRMQVQEAASGQTLNELALSTSLMPYLDRTAQALAQLHGLRLPEVANGSGPLEVDHYLLGDELANLDRFTADILAARPAHTAEVRSLRNGLLAWADVLPPLAAPTPIHRDFYYSQVLADGRRLTVIDFDLFALGDPAIDVANFVAHLYFLGLDKFGDLERLALEAEFFLAAYGRYRPMDSDFLQRLAFYQAATYFRLMDVVVSRPGLIHCFEPLQAQTAASLTAVPA
jgi:glycosyltransferase involved in cell wall biosynthesis/thiamine kinase-like enzyme